MSFETEAAAGVLPTHYPARDGKTVCIATMEDQHLYLSWKWQFEHFHRSPLYMALQREKERRAQIRRETREADLAVLQETGRMEIPMTDAVQVLTRLKRRIGKERARCNRLAEGYKSNGNMMGLERAFGEANVLSMTMRWIDEELKKLGPFEKMVKVRR